MALYMNYYYYLLSSLSFLFVLFDCLFVCITKLDTFISPVHTIVTYMDTTGNLNGFYYTYYNNRNVYMQRQLCRYGD